MTHTTCMHPAAALALLYVSCEAHTQRPWQAAHTLQGQ